jgi:hypothetical protein
MDTSLSVVRAVETFARLGGSLVLQELIMAGGDSSSENRYQVDGADEASAFRRLAMMRPTRGGR